MSHDFPSMLRDLQLKVTPRRLAILAALSAATTYVSPEEVQQKLQGESVPIGLPTVYRNLEELADGGVISKVLHPNRQLYYYFCPNRSHHHHFVCLSCRTVEDLDYCGLEELEKRIGGKVVSHIVQANGLCHACLQAGREVAA
jgi:Fe2+ or Zn2+ uptake regulation protein